MTSPYEDEGIPDVGRDDDPVEPPHDFPVAVEEFGTTAAEQLEGEPLEGRVARELPDTELGQDEDRAGRLVAPDEGAHEDSEKDLIATDVGEDLGGFTAEEAAMHVEPER